MSGETSTSGRRRPVRSGIVVPERPTFGGRLIARAIHTFIRTVDLTLRYRLDEPERARESLLAGPAIFTIWHNRLALSVMLYRRYVQSVQRGRRMAAIASASRDGATLARVIELLGVEPVRGSSSRRGGQALLEMATLAQKGYDLAVTPDGPRGPRYKLQPGVIGLAAATGLPIVLASFHAAWKKEVPSWDRFQIPLPGSPITVFISDRIHVPPEPDADERERLRAGVEQQLLAMSRD